MPSAEARSHQYYDRSAAEDSKDVDRAFVSCGARLARVSRYGEAADAPRSTTGCAVRACCCHGAGQRAAAARSFPHCRPRRDRTNQSKPEDWKGLGHNGRIPRRVPRARIASWSSGRRAAEHTQRSADLAWLCCGPIRGALHSHTAGRGSPVPTPRQVGSAVANNHWPARSDAVARVPRAYRTMESRTTDRGARLA